MMRLDDSWLNQAVRTWPLPLIKDLSTAQRLRWCGSQPQLLGDGSWEDDVGGSLRCMRSCLPPAFVDHISTLAWQVYVPGLTLLAPAMLPALAQLLYSITVLYLEPGDPYYRDHVAHQVRVALTGDVLLRVPYDVAGRHGQIGRSVRPWPKTAAELPDRGLILNAVACRVRDLANRATHPLSSFVKRLGLDAEAITPGLVLRAFWIAALCHDVGRAWQLTRDLAQKRLGKAELATLTFRPSLLPHFADRLKGELAFEYLKSLGLGPLSDEALLATACEPGHAGWSSLMLLMSHRWLSARCEILPESWLSLGLAAEAVLRHHGLESLGQYHPATYKNSPLAFLLQLCDTLDLMRPQLSWDHPAGNSRRFTLKRACERVDLATREGKLVVTWHIPKTADNREFRGRYLTLDQEKGIPAFAARFNPRDDNNPKGGQCDPRGIFRGVEFRLFPAEGSTPRVS